MSEAPPSTKLSKLRYVQASMLDTVSIEQLSVSRAVPYGGAASSLAVLLAITQVQSRAPDVQLAIAGAAFALPPWIVLATLYEFYVYLGQEAFPHYKTPFVQGMICKLGYLAGTALLLSIGGLLHSLLPWATWVYVFAIGLAFYFLHQFHLSLAKWWHEHGR